jgi:HEAT repeat protein
VTTKAQRRGAICAAVGAVACAGLLVLWATAPVPATRPARSDRSDDAVHALPAPKLTLTESPARTRRSDSDSSHDETGIDNPDELAALIVALGDADANLRIDAVSDLGLLSDSQAQSLLAITAMQDPAPRVRIEALYALETLRGESQRDIFRHALNDPDEDVRKAARHALAELGSEPPDDAE